MGPEVVNKNKNCVFNGPYAGRDLYITMYQDNEREFVVTHNANIKPVSYFTGRETELHDLRQRIEAGRKSVLVSGMGGIGKTHICRKLFEEYLNKHAKDGNGSFRHIGYIEYSGDMGSSLQNCLKFKQQDNPEQNREAAWEELGNLAEDGKLLLFVDNVDKSVSEDPGLQKLKEIPGAVILTSRHASFEDEFEVYHIGFLDTEQCKEIYEKIRFGGSERKVKPEEAPDLEYVIENLAGRHTITVELLAHLARTKTWPVRKLREKLEEKGFCLEFHKDGELVNIQKSYEVLYGLSSLTNAEQNILEAFSVFPYIPLAAETCNEWLLVDADVSKDDDILVGLYQKGWLQFGADQQGYTLHPVFAQFIYEKCRPIPERHQGLVKGCKNSLKIPESGVVLECKNYIPFAERIINRIDMKDATGYVEFLTSLAYLLQYIGEYEKAGNYYKQLIGIHERTPGVSQSAIAIDYQNLAYIYLMRKEYKEAEKLCKKSLRLWYDKNGTKGTSLLVATNYNNLAFIYQAQKRYGEAEDMYRESVNIQKDILGEKNSNIVLNYNNLAYLYECQGRYDEAEKLYIVCLQIDREVSKGQNINTAIIYNNLAKLYEIQHKHKYAFAYFFKAYKILFSKLGGNHLRTRIAYKNMKLVFMKLNPKGDFEQWLEEQMKEPERN